MRSGSDCSWESRKALYRGALGPLYQGCKALWRGERWELGHTEVESVRAFFSQRGSISHRPLHKGVSLDDIAFSGRGQVLASPRPPLMRLHWRCCANARFYPHPGPLPAREREKESPGPLLCSEREYQCTSCPSPFQGNPRGKSGFGLHRRCNLSERGMRVRPIAQDVL